MPSEPRPHLSDEDVTRLLALADQDCLNATLETEIRVLHDLQSARAELVALRELRAAVERWRDAYELYIASNGRAAYLMPYRNAEHELSAALRPAPAEGA